MLVGRGGLVLRQIARRDNQIAWAIFSVNGAKYRLIALPGIHPKQSFMLFGKKVGIGDL
jgi:hypothetical protein